MSGASPFPPGVTLVPGGANVAVVSRHAERVFFCLFEGDTEIARLPLKQRLGDVHYGFVPDVAAGARYGLRAEGPWQPENGHRFDVSKLLLDPYALELTGAFRHHADLARFGVDTAPLVPKAVLRNIPADARTLDPATPRFIYEVPVRAFTRLHPQVPEARRGTVAALAEPVVIDHILSLGVDTVELMPVAAWIDERHLSPLGLSNAWGYNPVGFLAPDPRLAPGGLAEIRRTVEALHGAGLRVLLDVVFNHSGESDAFGATLSFRGLDNALYYRQAGGQLVNDTGCGNTLALDERPVMQLAMDAMRSWVTRTGIDGFRFDLAPVMGRRADGFDPNAPLLAAIEQDPLLCRLTMIAEPWDVGPGGYRLGQFPARWQEWNDKYRDDVRRFWRGDDFAAGAFATRIAGSSDVFGPHRRPSCSINALAAHDGFTLRDAVTYAQKNNFANGEGNRDGNGHEPTWPGGDVKALLATLFLSRGTPMLTAGDEFGRTQGGNNNAYAQDNATTWLDWAQADSDLIGFVQSLAKLRQEVEDVLADRFLTGNPEAASLYPDAEWTGADGKAMAWDEPGAAILGLVLAGPSRRVAFLFNRSATEHAVNLPSRDGHRWTRLFCSAPGAELPPASVTVFAEEPLRNARPSDESVAALARDAGIETEWWEVNGTHHAVTAETLRHLLGALGLPHETADGIAEARRRLAAPPPLIAGAGSPCALGEPSGRRRQILIRDDAGVTRTMDVPPGETPKTQLDPGYYELRTGEHGETLRALIVSPGACHVPGDLARGHRVFGLASHLYAMRHAGGEGAGDFRTLARFADLAARVGGRYAGINPLHHLFPTDRSRASPYQPSDRHYIDPIYISIADMLTGFALPKARALAEASRAAFASLEALPLVDYRAVWEAKSRILEAAFAEFGGDPSFDAFCAGGGEALIAHGRFEAERASEKPTPDRIAYRAFLQWIAEAQLAAAAADRNLYRDLALGCAFDGGEIAARPDLFAPGVSIGAPPDPFSAAGQVWNLPPFSPLALAAQGMAPVRRLLAANMRNAAALRIDHVLGFARQFWVPRGAEGRHGAYVRFPLAALLAVTAIESQRHECLVIGEDLGTVPDGLRHALSEADVFSYRVLWFERDGLGFNPPETYPRKALACLASHDLPTFTGWRAGRDIAIDRQIGRIDDAGAAARRMSRADECRRLTAMTGGSGATDLEASIAAHAAVARAPSLVMLAQVDDLAGETDPLNLPGTDTEWPNWRRRVSRGVDDLDKDESAQAILAAIRKERNP